MPQLTWDLDPVLLGGPVPFRTYGLLLSLALVGGFLLFRWQMMRDGHSEETAGWFMAYGLLGAVPGARLGHCLFYDLPRTLADPWSVLRPWEGGLSSHGALVGLTCAALVYSRRHRVAFTELADKLALGGALAVVLVRVANFFNSEVVGRPTDGTWGVRFLRWDGPSAPLRHPVQLYEAALGLVLLGLLLLFARRRQRPTGLLASLFLVSYFGVRMLIETVKEPEGLPSSSPVTLGQLFSIIPFVLGAIWLALLIRRQRRPAGGGSL